MHNISIFEKWSSFFTFRNCVVSKLLKYRFTAIFGILFGVILYSLMMTQQLTNTFDGLWHQNYHHAGVGELSSGRWLLVLVDKLVMGTHADPVISIVALALYVIGFLFVLDLFNPTRKSVQCLCMALFISSTLISTTLSYRYTSLGYGLSFLLAVLSIYAIIKIRNHYFGICISGILLGLSMACYQAYLATFCIIAVFYAIYCCKERKMISSETSSLSSVSYLVRIILTVCIGMLFYYVSLTIFLKLYDVSLSNYNGAGQVSLGEAFSNLPQNILKTYQFFYAYFFMDGLTINRLQPFGIFYILMAFLIGEIIFIAIKTLKIGKKWILLLIPAVIAIPIASNAYMLLAGDKLELQMTTGLAIFAPLTMLILFSSLEQKRIVQIICTCLCIALIYGNSIQVWIDQEAMYEGQNACDTMITQVIDDLSENNLLSADYEYFFIGVPEGNPLFSVSNTYYSANAYAQMGRFWVSGNCCQSSYRGLISRRMGLDLLVSTLSYDDISGKTDTLKMPVFPIDGYIMLLDGNTVVVKISEYNAYTGNSKYTLDSFTD